MCDFDDRGNIGKRYRREDEIGTPFCVTYDFDSEEDNAVTVKYGDAKQVKSVVQNAREQYLKEIHGEK